MSLSGEQAPVDRPDRPALDPAQRPPLLERRLERMVIEVVDAREEAARVVTLRAAKPRAVEVVAELVQQRVEERLGARHLLADGRAHPDADPLRRRRVVAE